MITFTTLTNACKRLARAIGLLPHQRASRAHQQQAQAGQRVSHTQRKALKPSGKPIPSFGTIPVDPDLIGLVEFGSSARVLLPMMVVTNPRVESACNALNADGGATNVDRGLNAAIGLLDPLDRTLIKRVVLVSDGSPTCDTNALIAQAKRMKRAHIRLDCISMGDANGGNLLRQLAGLSHNGRWFSARDFKSLMRAVLGNVNQGERHRYRGATVLLIDASGSMGGALPADPKYTRIAACREAARMLVRSQARLYGHKVR